MEKEQNKKAERQNQKIPARAMVCAYDVESLGVGLVNRITIECVDISPVPVRKLEHIGRIYPDGSIKSFLKDDDSAISLAKVRDAHMTLEQERSIVLDGGMKKELVTDIFVVYKARTSPIKGCRKGQKSTGDEIVIEEIIDLTKSKVRRNKMAYIVFEKRWERHEFTSKAYSVLAVADARSIEKGFPKRISDLYMDDIYPDRQSFYVLPRNKY